MSMLPDFVDLEEFDEPLEYDPFVSKIKNKKKYVMIEIIKFYYKNLL